MTELCIFEWTIPLNGVHVNWSEGRHLFECGDIAGDVLHSNRVLHCESVALALYSSSVDDNPGICRQTWTAQKQTCQVHIQSHIIKDNYFGF